jgi:CIC family chloride channel protein
MHGRAERRLRLFRWLKGRRWIIVDTVLLGVVGALSAQVFTLMLKGAQTYLLTRLAGYTPPGLPDEGGVLRQVIGGHGMWLVPLATALGGLISGLLVYSLAPEAEGHGTDTAVKAFHRAAGFIRARVAPLKAVASAITIGSGGAAGREGPTALISAGVGSIYATLGKRSDEDRRLLVLIGMAAGLAAIFRSPIGTAIFAIEVLYTDMEFEAGALLYTLLGSLVAYVVNGLFVGWKPLFQVPPGLSVPAFTDYAWYAALGAASGITATLLPVVFYGTRDLFHKLRIPPHIKPAIGGFGVGVLALVLPQVLGGGYGWIQEAIDGRLSLMILFALIFAKMLAFALTVSSGGSGGVFAPSLFVGAMVGGFLAKIFHQPSAAYVIVGMAAVFGGAARVPIATLLMVTEMTGGYQLLVPAALAVTLSYLVQTVLSSHVKYRSLYEAQLPSRAASPAHDMDNMCIALDLMCKPWAPDPGTPLHVDLLSLLRSGVAVSLAQGKRLTLGILRKKSPWVEKPLRAGYLAERSGETTLLAILREGQIIVPHRETILHAGDRLLMIASPEAQERLNQHLAPLSSERASP